VRLPQSTAGRIFEDKTYINQLLLLHCNDGMETPEVLIRYLLNETYVLSNSLLELCPASWENKIVARHSNPILILFILNKLGVRYIVIPYLAS
jgi:hypothetical protein